MNDGVWRNDVLDLELYTWERVDAESDEEYRFFIDYFVSQAPHERSIATVLERYNAEHPNDPRTHESKYHSFLRLAKRFNWRNRALLYDETQHISLVYKWRSRREELRQKEYGLSVDLLAFGEVQLAAYIERVTEKGTALALKDIERVIRLASMLGRNASEMWAIPVSAPEMDQQDQNIAEVRDQRWQRLEERIIGALEQGDVVYDYPSDADGSAGILD